MNYIYPKAEPFFLSGHTDTALLFIHGFTASPSEVYPTAKLIHEMSGHTVSGILLPGHGSSPRQLNNTNWKEWFKAVEKELEFLLGNYKRVFIAGLSMGALLALHAAEMKKELKAVVSINAPIYNNFPLLTFLAPFIKYLIPYFPKGTGSGIKKLKKEGRFAYKVTPVKAFLQMMSLRRQVILGLKNIGIPLLVIQSQHDESVNKKSAEFLLDRSCQEESCLLKLNSSGHIATMGVEKNIIAEKILEFINDK